ncbi:ROK family protein [Arachidicoccus sp.]|uniref:ROK family transcriptional regulator n=1 Tax=Arachidicoccus sp. TaxID=1872624 RepID=UPI003D24A4FC
MNTKNTSYKKSILGELFLTNSSSCAELSERMGKSLSLATKMVNELVEEDLVIEKGLAPSSGGRRPLTYSLRPDSFYIVAVAMDQFVSRIAILDAHKNFVTPTKEIELALAKNDQALEKLTEHILSVIETTKIDRDKVIGIGIGMPGFIDPHKGANYTFLGADICNYIQSKTNLPVFIENDSSAIALAEYKFGAARGESNAMVVNIGWGVGLGMIIDNKLFRGEDGFAGEFSHIPLFQNGKLCSCGKIGCLETESSLNYMLDRAATEIENGKASFLKSAVLSSDKHETKFQQFIQAAIIGDSVTVGIISDVGYNIGRGIAILIHLLNPSKIVLSGRGSAAGKIWLAPIQHAIPRLVSNTKIVVSTLNHDAEIIGAASLVIENIKDCPMEKIFLKHSLAK